MPKLMEILFGGKDKIGQFQNLNPEQMQGIMQLFQGLLGGGGAFGDMLGQFDPNQAAQTFEQGVAAPARRGFQQQTLPGIMQNFADQGPSSGLNQSLATAGRQFESDLSSQLANFIFQSKQQQNSNRLTGLGLGLGTQTFQPTVQQGSPGFVNSFLQGFGQNAGKAMGGYFL